MVNVQINFFLQGKSIVLPFDFDINGNTYVCSEVLRLLPRKRIVLKAESEGKLYVIKLFSNAQKGKRELERELSGYQLTQKSGIHLPQVEFVSDDVEDYSAIAYEFIEHAAPFHDDPLVLSQYAVSLFNLVSTLHNSGIYQDDFHLDNLLIADEQLFLIDLASVKSEHEARPLNKQKSVENLAMLVAQFIPKQQQILIDKLAHYYEKRGWSWTEDEQDEFVDITYQAWQQRKNLYLKKRFRSCTMTAYDKTFSQQSAFRRSFLDEVGSDFINNIDTLVEQGECLKDGNSATVVKVSYAGKQLVIKRYNIKSFWHGLKRCYRPSRAAVSWRNGNLLELMGIATPTALGFIEQRFAWLRKRAYLICEYSDGQELFDVYQSRSPTAIELAGLKEMFSLLRSYKVSHGDLKASNLLLDKQSQLMMIDLDAMHEHVDNVGFQKAYDKDKQRFLKNWQQPVQQTLFKTALFNRD